MFSVASHFSAIFIDDEGLEQRPAHTYIHTYSSLQPTDTHTLLWQSQDAVPMNDGLITQPVPF